MSIALILTLTLSAAGQGTEVDVRTSAELQEALRKAKPGMTIAIAPGTYEGGLFASDLQGTASRPIRIQADNPKEPPVFRGGGTAIQLSKVSHLEISNIRIEKCLQNGLNIDDGGERSKPSHHVTLRGIVVADLPKGNHDGIKLSGLDDFRVEDCRVARWGGSAIDMVGCHRGRIVGCEFREGGDSAVQAKGGSSDVAIESSLFVDYGQRGVNLGGSTGFEFFRPPLEGIPAGERFEAKDIAVRGCTFVRGVAPIAFVGSDSGTFAFNTIFQPGRWAMRILQETRDPSFLPSRKGQFCDNLVVFLSGQWGEGGVNVGSGTDAASFRFARNHWFCSDRPEASRPRLPSNETEGVYGVDPLIRLTPEGRIEVGKDSPAKAGAHAFRPSAP